MMKIHPQRDSMTLGELEDLGEELAGNDLNTEERAEKQEQYDVATAVLSPFVTTFLADLASQSIQINALGEGTRRAVASGIDPSSVVELNRSIKASQSRLRSALTPTEQWLQEVASQAAEAHRVVASSLAQTWVTAATADLQRLATANTALAARSPELLWLADSAAKISRRLTSLDTTPDISAAVRSLTAWTPIGHSMVTSAEATSLGLLSGYAALGFAGSEVAHADTSTTTAHLVNTTVINPWLSARVSQDPELWQALHSKNPELADFFDRAWADVEDDSIAYLVTASSPAIELYDRYLRQQADKQDVLDWHTSTGRNSSELNNQGEPTRVLKVRYLCRHLDRKRRDMVVGQAQAFERMYFRMQASKHDSASDKTELTTCIMSLEVLLRFLLLPAPR